MKYLSILFLSFILFSCIEEVKEDPATVETLVAEKDGITLFKENCVVCHGMDGKLGFSGAKDLTKSTTALDEIVHQVTNGKGAMAGFEKKLSVEEIKTVSEYAITLR